MLVYVSVVGEGGTCTHQREHIALGAMVEDQVQQVHFSRSPVGGTAEKCMPLLSPPLTPLLMPSLCTGEGPTGGCSSEEGSSEWSGASSYCSS